MAMTITARDIELIHQRNRTVLVRLELMNKRKQVIATLEGECIDAPLNLDSASDVRRTCALALHVKDATYIASENTRVWFDKSIRVSYGLYDGKAKDFRYYTMGEFVIASTDYTFDAENQRLDASLVDPMALATPERGSAIGASKTVIEVGMMIRSAMIGVLMDLVGWNAYRIDEFTEADGTVPYDLEFEMGVYPYELISKLRDIYPGYETFFAADGVFVCQKIPDCLEDSLVLTADVMDKLVTSQGVKPKLNFSEMKNTTELWGRSLEADRWSDVCVSTGAVYKLTIPDITVMDSGKTYGFKTDAASQAGQAIRINNLSAYPIYVSTTLPDGTDSDVPIQPGQMKAGAAYVLLYSNGRFYLQGELEIHVVVMEVNRQPDESTIQHYKELWNCDNIRFVINPESPFAADRGDMGVVKQVLHGGDYDNIYTTELAYDRAAYENWKTTRLVETTIVEMLMVPWLDVNQKVEMTSVISGRKEQYLVKSIAFNLAQSTMTVELIRFYPYFPWLT